MIDPDTRVRAVMSAPVRSVEPTCTLHEAADVLLSAGIGSVVVADDRPGILTKTDLVTALRESYDPGATPVTAVMTPDPVTVDADAPVQAAIDAMDDHGIKRLPVTAGGEVVGIVTTTDLVATAAADVRADGADAVGVFAAAFTAGGDGTYECLGCGERVVADRHPGECAECGQPVRNITVARD
jgi:CBS domain-containing protein